MRTTRFIIPLVALALCVMPAVALASNGGTTHTFLPLKIRLDPVAAVAKKTAKAPAAVTR